MARTVNRTEVRKATAPGMYPDGGNLYLQVARGG